MTVSESADQSISVWTDRYHPHNLTGLKFDLPPIAACLLGVLLYLAAAQRRLTQPQPFRHKARLWMVIPNDTPNRSVGW